MSVSFVEYAATMVGCYAAMPEAERESLLAWEAVHLDGSGKYSSSDWPGWEKYIGKFEAPQFEEKKLFGYVYLILASTGHCKIGSTQSVKTRLRQLQCANPEPLVLLHHFPSANAQKAEFSLHKQFSEKRVNNEWFALTDTDIAHIASIAAADGS